MDSLTSLSDRMKKLDQMLQHAEQLKADLTQKEADMNRREESLIQRERSLTSKIRNFEASSQNLRQEEQKLDLLRKELDVKEKSIRAEAEACECKRAKLKAWAQGTMQHKALLGLCALLTLCLTARWWTFLASVWDALRSGLNRLCGASLAVCGEMSIHLQEWLSEAHISPLMAIFILIMGSGLLVVIIIAILDYRRNH